MIGLTLQPPLPHRPANTTSQPQLLPSSPPTATPSGAPKRNPTHDHTGDRSELNPTHGNTNRRSPPTSIPPTTTLAIPSELSPTQRVDHPGSRAAPPRAALTRTRRTPSHPSDVRSATCPDRARRALIGRHLRGQPPQLVGCHPWFKGDNPQPRGLTPEMAGAGGGLGAGQVEAR